MSERERQTDRQAGREREREREREGEPFLMTTVTSRMRIIVSNATQDETTWAVERSERKMACMPKNDFFPTESKVGSFTKKVDGVN